MENDLKAQLLKPRVPEGTVELDGLGIVRVRGLSRGEVLETQRQELDLAGFERKMVAMGMVDPAMTEDEVQQWQENSVAGELEAVTEKINELSGLTNKSDKRVVESFREEPGAGV